MDGALHLIIYSQDERLLEQLAKQGKDYKEVLLFSLSSSEEALLVIQKASLYPLLVVVEGATANLSAFKLVLDGMKQTGFPCLAIYTAAFSPKHLALSYACGFDEFLAAPINLQQLLSLAANKGLLPPSKAISNANNLNGN